MPFKSKAQRRKFWAMADKGEMSEDTVREWERETENKDDLPERASSQDKEASFVLDRARYAGALDALERLGIG